MVNTGTKLTLEEFLALPEGDVNYEFVDGQAVPNTVRLTIFAHWRSP